MTRVKVFKAEALILAHRIKKYGKIYDAKQASTKHCWNSQIGLTLETNQSCNALFYWQLPANPAKKWKLG